MTTEVIQSAKKATPELLKNPENWRAFEIKGSHSDIQRLVCKFGKYFIILDVRRKRKGGEGFFSYGGSQYTYVLEGVVDIILWSYDRKKNKKIGIIAGVQLGPRDQIQITSHAGTVFVPQPFAHTFSIGRRWPKRDEEFEKSLKDLPPETKERLINIFKIHYPGN